MMVSGTEIQPVWALPLLGASYLLYLRWRGSLDPEAGSWISQAATWIRLDIYHTARFVGGLLAVGTIVAKVAGFSILGATNLLPAVWFGISLFGVSLAQILGILNVGLPLLSGVVIFAAVGAFLARTFLSE